MHLASPLIVDGMCSVSAPENGGGGGVGVGKRWGEGDRIENVSVNTTTAYVHMFSEPHCCNGLFLLKTKRGSEYNL